MSRKVREIKKNFKVFCESDTEYHYNEYFEITSAF